MLAYASEKLETLVSKGRHLHDSIAYYDASVVQKFVGTGTATQHECMILSELAPHCSDGSWAGGITACLASEALGYIVKFIHPVDKKTGVKEGASAVSRGRGRKGLTFGDNRWSKAYYVPTGTHTKLHVRGTGGKGDMFVEEATVTFTKHVKHRVSPLSEHQALKIAEVGEDTDVKGLCYFAAIVPKDGNSRPFPIHLAAPPLYMCKARVHICSRAIPGSNVPPTSTVTSLHLHCCCPLLLNLNDFDLVLEIVLVCFRLPGQRGRTFVRCRACSMHKQCCMASAAA